MSWTYEMKFDDPARGRLDVIRFIIGDTDPDYAYLMDEEIALIIRQAHGDVHGSAIIAVRRIIAKVSSQVDYKIGPELVKASGRLKHFQALLASLVAENMLYSLDLSGTVATHDPVFNYGMDDNYGPSGPSISPDRGWRV